MEAKLLTRDNFRESVFERDNHKCVFCNEKAVDAHHILERRLWKDGGYYLDNGASVCEEHHLACERTDISVEEVREKCGITNIVKPEHLYDDEIYDKWGNIVRPDGHRVKGELFYDESVQKIIKEHLSLFIKYTKYPRTYHMPYSEGISKDDKQLSLEKMCEYFDGKRVIITEKMDGENTSLYNDKTHARSIDSRNHPSRNWLKKFWNDNVSGQLPEDWRICGENLYAEHSIHYKLKTYFNGFSIWNEKNVCLGWDETLEYFELLNIEPVKVLYDGVFSTDVIKQLIKDLNLDEQEGLVMRLADSFEYKEFKKSVCKFVRKDHIRTTKHWMMGQEVIPNDLI